MVIRRHGESSCTHGKTEKIKKKDSLWEGAPYYIPLAVSSVDPRPCSHPLAIRDRGPGAPNPHNALLADPSAKSLISSILSGLAPILGQ